SDFIQDSLSHGATKFMGVCRLDPESRHRRLDLLLLPKEQFHCGVLYFTGSDAFNKKMRSHALERGFTLNEHSLRPVDSAMLPLEPLPVSSEEDIFDYISFDYKSPEERSL
ncbi:DNA polymerase beta, partial [Caligus rogercresseyi]